MPSHRSIVHASEVHTSWQGGWIVMVHVGSWEAGRSLRFNFGQRMAAGGVGGRPVTLPAVTGAQLLDKAAGVLTFRLKATGQSYCSQDERHRAPDRRGLDWSREKSVQQQEEEAAERREKGVAPQQGARGWSVPHTHTLREEQRDG